MSAHRRTMTSVGAGLALALTLTLTLAAPWEPAPPRVHELCGDPPIPEESLCNVEDGLQDAFGLVEHIVGDGGEISFRVPAVVRDRLVSVEWYPNPDPRSVRAGLAGMYEEASHRVILPQGLRAEPLRVRASIVAHELGHAALIFDDLGVRRTPAETCFEQEALAFKIGMRVYERARRLVDEPTGGEDSVDRHLADEVELWRRLSGGGELTPSGLDDLANHHVFLHGYAIDCNWR